MSAKNINRAFLSLNWIVKFFKWRKNKKTKEFLSETVKDAEKYKDIKD